MMLPTAEMWADPRYRKPGDVVSSFAFVGEAPSTNPGYKYALYPWPPGCAGDRLWKMVGISKQQWLTRFDRTNVFDAPQAAKKGGAEFPMAEARRRVLVMAPHLVERNVVLVGMRVAEAFGAGKGLFFWREVKVGMVTLNVSVMPHPSGRNRMLNSPTMMRDARTFLRTVVEVGCRQCQEEPEWVS
jgi:hypothetical protein